MSHIIKTILLFFIFILLAPPTPAQPLATMESNQVTVLFDSPLDFAAQDIIGMYPGIRAELEAALLWRVDLRPTVVLIRDSGRFRQMAGHSSYVAYALPDRQLIVIDYSRMNTGPFTLRITLKHELCHLVLHDQIRTVPLPKWLDEGVAQWTSDGIAEILTGRSGSLLGWAGISGRFYRLDAISKSFPSDEQGLVLAYEQSRLLVEYIIEHYGRNAILNILEAMKNNNAAPEAIEMSLMITSEELERSWLQDRQKWSSLLLFLAGNIYTLLFVAAALLTVAVYVRMMVRKRRFGQDEDDEEQGGFAP